MNKTPRGGDIAMAESLVQFSVKYLHWFDFATFTLFGTECNLFKELFLEMAYIE